MTGRSAKPAPLQGIRVVDLTTTFMGPYCTLLLAQMGADVIKVEAPDGDIVRYIGPERNHGMGTIFLNANQGKRSIALDLKDQRGMAVMERLLAGADVFVTNMRPRAVDKLNLTAARVRELNDRIIYCSLTGFGSKGPYRENAAYDDVIQAVCGLASVQAGEDSPPSYVRTPVADKVTGLMGVGAILAALLGRASSGTGQTVEVPMYETMAEFLLLDQQGGMVFDPPIGPTGYARTSSPFRKPYRTKDDYLGVVVYTDRQWLSFFDLIGQPELADDPRFDTITARTRNIDALYQILEAEMSTRTNAEWTETLVLHNIPCTPVNTVADLLVDKHLESVDFFTSVDHPTEGRLRMPRLPITFTDVDTETHRPAPRLGEHGPDLLRELGYPAEEVASLLGAGVVGGAGDGS
ncbi:Formyl-CoA transferase [Mycolicibacterium rhodesiae JS60]|nr:Formyl-CoA transferase [Mycolicibacterium rhodesiae JS60]